MKEKFKKYYEVAKEFVIKHKKEISIFLSAYGLYLFGYHNGTKNVCEHHSNFYDIHKREDSNRIELD